MKKVYAHLPKLRQLLLVGALGALAFATPASLRAAEDPFGKIYVDTGRIGSAGNASVKAKGIPFVNRLINFSSAVAAITLLVVILINAITIINNEKGAEALRQATTNILLSILGLGITASAYIVTGYIGNVFYGDANYFLDPASSISASKYSGTKTTNSWFATIGWGIDKWLGLDNKKTDIYQAIDEYVPTTNQVFGSPEPIARSGVAAQSYTQGPQNIISTAVGLLAAAAALWLLVAIIWNGYKIITGSGDPESLAKAIRTIGISAIGFVIAAMAYLITSFVSQQFFGRNVLDEPVQELTTNPS